MAVLCISTLAAASVMGQQAYEQAIIERAATVLGPGWGVRTEVLRSLRSPLPGSLRLPSWLLTSAPAAARGVAGALVHRGCDVAHRMDLRIPPARRREILTIHDVVSWRFADEGRPPSTAVREARSAVRVVCPSAFSADEIATVLGVRSPVVIPNGIEPRFANAVPLAAAELAGLHLQTPYVVHSGGCSRRKNLDALADAWPRVRSRHPNATLALVGPPDRRRDTLFGPLAGCVRLGRVDADTLASLVAGAAALVVPSLYEGFGLPALEAMSAGTAVVASNRSSLPEVCGDAAVLVEPDAGAIADGLADVLCGGSAVEAMVQRGRERAALFSWEQSARRHAELWKAVAA